MFFTSTENEKKNEKIKTKNKAKNSRAHFKWLESWHLTQSPQHCIHADQIIQTRKREGLILTKDDALSSNKPHRKYLSHVKLVQVVLFAHKITKDANHAVKHI